MAQDPNYRYSIVKYPGDGVQTDWDVSFAGGYISADNIYARSLDPVSGATVDLTVQVLGPGAGGTRVRVTPAVAVGLDLQIYRYTQRAGPLVDFKNRSMLTETNLNTITEQAIFSVAELEDQSNETRDQVERQAARVEEIYGAVQEIYNDSLAALVSSYYFVPVAYASGLVVDKPQFTVQYEGAIYGADPTRVPFTTGPVFDSGDWRLLQGVTAADLAGSGGAGAIGFLATGAPANAKRTLLSKGRDMVTPEDFRVPGETDADAIMRALAVSDDVFLPAHRTYNLDRGVVLERNGQRLHGRGKLVAASAVMANQPIVLVKADHCTVEGLLISNPNEYFATSGERQYGISVQGQGAVIRGNSIRNCQQGISVRASGEYYDTVIANNVVTDCIGIGPSALPQTLGEDRGDGITSWGARTVITGNTVTMKAGYDGRVGIHAEGLPGFAPNPGPMPDRVCTISGNIVYGSFRRGIVLENVSNYTVTGNVLPGGYTWWAMALILASGQGVVSGNSIYYNRPSGVAVPWSPTNAAVYILSNDAGGILDGLIFSSNIVRMGPAVTAARGVYAQGTATGRVRRLTIADNQFHSEATNGAAAVQVQNCDGVAVSGNRMTGTFQQMVAASGCVDCSMSRNEGSKTTGTDYTFANVTGIAVFSGNVCTSGNGASAASGTLGNLFGTHDNIGFATVVGSAFTQGNLETASHRVNTFGKYVGKLITTNAGAYVATGSAATSTWIRLTDNSIITPI